MVSYDGKAVLTAAQSLNQKEFAAGELSKITMMHPSKIASIIKYHLLNKYIEVVEIRRVATTNGGKIKVYSLKSVTSLKEAKLGHSSEAGA